MFKKYFYPVMIFAPLAYLLFCPQNAYPAASAGLMLWFQKLLPVLLPFSILSAIILSSNLLSGLSVFYPLIAGFLFGFPIGSMLTSELVTAGKLSQKKACIMICVCNNMGPGFICGYLHSQPYWCNTPAGLICLSIYLPPIIIGSSIYFLDILKNSSSSHLRDLPLNIIHHIRYIFTPLQAKNKASRSQINFKIIDAGIMSGFEVLTRVGGYILLYSIISDMLCHIPCPNNALRVLLVGITEVTNGVNTISNSTFLTHNKMILSAMCCSFGGISGLSQSLCYLNNTGLSVKKYVIFKSICSILTGLLIYYCSSCCSCVTSSSVVSGLLC